MRVRRVGDFTDTSLSGEVYPRAIGSVEQSTEGAAMATKVEVQRNHSVGVDTHVVEGEPKGLSGLVNDAIKANDKFVTFVVPGGKKLSVVAERVEAIWEE
jgi:hypothetical protein